MENLIRLIDAQHAQFSKGQRRIAAYLRDNYDSAAFLTANKLGRTVGVSESTVVRFAYALGLDGYPALQEALQDLVRHKLTTAQRIQMTGDLSCEDVLKTVLSDDMQNIKATLEMADGAVFARAVEALINARRIYVLGLRSAMPIASFLSYYLDYVCENVMFVNGAVQDLRERLVRVSERDVLIGISFPRYSARTIDAMRYAKSKHAHVLAITDAADSPAAGYADEALLAKSNSTSFVDSMVAPLSLIEALLVAAGLAHKEQVYGHLKELEDVWGFEGVYRLEEEPEERL